jgi:hypothetical protein
VFSASIRLQYWSEECKNSIPNTSSTPQSEKKLVPSPLQNSTPNTSSTPQSEKKLVPSSLQNSTPNTSNIPQSEC